MVILLGTVLIFLLFFLPPIDTDLGWHLRYGAHLLQTGSVWRQNELTFLLPRYDWSHSYTLYQFITAVIFKLAGFWGLALAYALLLTFTFWLFSKLNSRLFRFNLVAFLFICWLGWGVLSLGWRAQVFSLTGLILTYQYIGLLARERGFVVFKFVLLPVFLFAAWANLHGGFVLGLALLALAAGQAVLQRNFRQVLGLAVTTVVSALGALLNPFGWGVYREAIRHISYPLQSLIAEWVPPPTLFKVGVLTLGAFAFLAVFHRRNKRAVFWGLSLILFTWLALKARRNLPLFGLIAALSVRDSFRAELQKLEQGLVFKRLGLLTAAAVAGWLFFFRLPLQIAPLESWPAYCQSARVRLPCRAVEFLRESSIPGQNIFAAYEWGGFLEWQLPGDRFFADGRMPAWETPSGKSPYTLYLEVIQAQSGYQEKLEKYGADALLIQNGTFLDLELQQDENTNWQEVYRDETAAIYNKRQN